MTIRELLQRIGLLNPKPDGLEEMALACTDRHGHVSRRAFFAILGTAAVAVAAFDPEQLLWTPGETGLVLPTAAEAATYGGRALVSPDWITFQMARLLEQNLRFTANVNRDYGKTFQIGDQVAIKRADPRPVTITDQLSVTVPAEMMQQRIEQGATSDEIRQQFLAPAAAELARRARESNLDTFVPINLPLYVYGKSINVQKRDGYGVPVRGVLAADHGQVGAPVMMRFDILGGSTKPVPRITAKDEEDRLDDLELDEYDEDGEDV